jgi:nucleoside-diphosphate-sugar epimerase
MGLGQGSEQGMTKILVTGGGGFLGGAIVERLVERGDEVSSFSRGTYPALSRLGVRQITGDLRSASGVRNACKGIDLVFHVAAKAGIWGSYREYYEINKIGRAHV